MEGNPLGGRNLTRAIMENWHMLTQSRTPAFPFGNVYITRGAKETLLMRDVADGLLRHLSGDWGDVCKDDWEENQLSLKHGFRLLSSYVDRNDHKFWIITEADRSTTTILLPREY